MNVISLSVGPIGANCYIVYCPKTLETAVIDPGGEHNRIIDELLSRDLIVKYIIITHGHFDHIGAVKGIKEFSNAQIAIHEYDSDKLTDDYKNLSLSMGNQCVQSQPDIILKDGDQLHIGEITLTILHTPGHSKGSICILTPEAIFTGDTLFAGSIGRTDFYDGDYFELINSIKNRLLLLDDSIKIYPGHGPSTSIVKEKQINPFFSLNMEG